MRKFICLTLLLAFISIGFAQKNEPPTALQSMVDTERAFAHMSEEQGVRPAFMAFIADDGILFRPTAVKGKQWMMDHPLPASDKRPLLSWQPTFADMALAGDMGYTTGPWEYKADMHDEKPVAWGNFLTVWKKQADGSWKFAIDLGISNPQPEQPPTPWQLPDNYRQKVGIGHTLNVKEVRRETDGLLAREREFSNVSSTRGPLQAFEEFAAVDVRVFRNGQSPIIGKANAAAVLTPIWTWEPAFADVSLSGDLGYTYGTYRLANTDMRPKSPKMPTNAEVGNYYRIWKKEAGVWKVVTDLLDPLPEKKQN